MLRGFVPIRGCFAASMVALVWSLSSSVVLRALSDSEESVAAHGAVMVDALPSKSSSLPADALLSRLLGRMLCRLEVYLPQLKALVWFWIIDETLILTSILSVCRLNEVGTCQVMIMVMMVTTTR